MENKEIIRQIAAKVLHGTATDEEKKKLHQWYDSMSIEEREELKIPELSPKGRIYKNIVKEISDKEGNRMVVSHRSFSKWIWTAASVLFLVLSYSIYFFLASHSSVEWISINVPLGKMEKIVLPDSSIVWLNAGSEFRYPTQYSESERHVVMVEGQAFFEVQKNKHKPFTVSSNELLVTVVGTSFDVKAFADAQSTVVGVKTGLVNVTHQNINQKTLLRPGDMASVDNMSGALNQWTQDVQLVGSWKENRMIFDGEPLNEVINALERTYDVKIITNNQELLSLPVSIKTDNQPLKDILEVLGYSLGFEYRMEMDNKRIIITKNK